MPQLRGVVIVVSINVNGWRGIARREFEYSLETTRPLLECRRDERPTERRFAPGFGERWATYQKTNRPKPTFSSQNRGKDGAGQTATDRIPTATEAEVGRDKIWWLLQEKKVVRCDKEDDVGKRLRKRRKETGGLGWLEKRGAR